MSPKVMIYFVILHHQLLKICTWWDYWQSILVKCQLSTHRRMNQTDKCFLCHVHFRRNDLHWQMPHFLFTFYWPIYLEWHYFKKHTVCYGGYNFIFSLPHWANNSTAISSTYAILECLQSWKRWKYRHWLFPLSAYQKCSAEERVPSLGEWEKLATQRCLNSWLPVKETSIDCVWRLVLNPEELLCTNQRRHTDKYIFNKHATFFTYVNINYMSLLGRTVRHFYMLSLKRENSGLLERLCGYCAVQLFHRRHFDTSQEEMHSCI